MGLVFKRSMHRFAVWALVAPFLLFSLFSNAVMPVSAPDGLVLVICTGEGPLEMVIDPETGEPVPKPAHDGSVKCSWAGANGPVLLSSPMLAPIRARSGRPVYLPAVPAVLVAAHATGLPPSTGPPLVL